MTFWFHYGRESTYTKLPHERLEKVLSDGWSLPVIITNPHEQYSRKDGTKETTLHTPHNTQCITCIPRFPKSRYIIMVIIRQTFPISLHLSLPLRPWDFGGNETDECGRLINQPVTTIKLASDSLQHWCTSIKVLRYLTFLRPRPLNNKLWWWWVCSHDIQRWIRSNMRRVMKNRDYLLGRPWSFSSASTSPGLVTI